VDVSGAVAATEETEETADDTVIWDEKEVPDVDVGDISMDPRERPEFDIKYRQAVTPEDVYLQVLQQIWQQSYYLCHFHLVQFLVMSSTTQFVCEL
jgi:hypothetical protein